MLIPSVVAVLALLAAPVSQPPSGEKPAEPREGSLLTIEAVEVDPPKPGPDTLCKLRVRLRNRGKQAASALSFQVTLNGEPVSVYSNQTFMTPVAPGKDADVPLYNFWTTESGRAAPKDGRLVVEVRVTAARWYDIDEEGHLSNPAGEVEPLPPPRSVTLALGGK